MISIESIYSIKQTDNTQLAKEKIYPNVYFNRHDINFKDNFKIFELFDGHQTFYIPVTKKGTKLYIGAYLLKTQPTAIEFLIKYLSSKYIFWTTAIFYHCATKLKKIKAASHYHVDLKTTIEDFNKRLSTKTRYNTRWYPKKIENDFGHYSISILKKDKITEEVILEYFELKRHTIPLAYKNISPKKYIEDFHITEIHILSISGKVGAMLLLSSINDADFYLENIAYSSFFSKYSPGSVLYYHSILNLISRGANALYLGGGDLDYKKRFNGIETQTYTGVVHRFSAK